MSVLVADPEVPPAEGGLRPVALVRRPVAGLACGVALVLAAAAFVADGGLRLERTTHVEMALMLLGAAGCAAALLVPRARAARLHGGWFLLAFASLAAFTAASIAWSLAPSDSLEEAHRTLAYLAVAGGTVALARLAGDRWPAVLHGIALACVLVCGWALATKVLPGALAADETYARLRAPFGYWNAVGLMAAMGLLPLLWLGARRSGHAAVNALAWPGIAMLELALMLSYSRGALLALAAGLVVWFAVVPLRLRGAVVLLGASAGGAALTGWAFSMTALTSDDVPLPVRADAGRELGSLLLVVCLCLLVVGLAAGFLAAERPASAQAKRVAGHALLGVLLAVPVIAVIALATAPGGIDGQLGKGWDRLTDPGAPTPANTPSRLTATSSVRARYWDEALRVHQVSPWVGTGAGAYATVRTRFRTGTLFVRHAHGYVPQTLADLGWAGLGLALLTLALWLGAAARACGLRPRDRGLPWDAERVGMATLVAVAVTFGVHSAVDWTWFVPANALCGLVAAAWVASRPPVRDRLGPARVLVAAPATARPVTAGRLWAAPVLPPAAGAADGADGAAPPVGDVAGPGALPVAEAQWRRRRRRVPWPAAAGAVAVLALGLAGAWSAFQPVRAVHAEDVAVGRLERGELDAAASVAEIAHRRNPLSPEPLWTLAYVQQQRGRLADAEHALQDAVRVAPASAEAWRRLGGFRLDVLNQPSDALAAFRAAYFLDPRNPISTSDFLGASRAGGSPGATPPVTP